MTKTDYTSLLKTLGLRMADTALLKRAFTHCSVGRTHIDHNERLEFLGDAVLELATTEYLFHQFPQEREGVLTMYRSALVQKKSLARVARELKLGEYIRMSKGEKATGGADKDYILANAVEALIGAIYLKMGLSAAREMVEQWVISPLQDLLDEEAHIDSKSKLQVICQAEMFTTPTYKMMDSSGADHAKTFLYAVLAGAKQLGQGEGSSKKLAQMSAAEDALARESEWRTAAA